VREVFICKVLGCAYCCGGTCILSFILRKICADYSRQSPLLVWQYGILGLGIWW